MAPNDTLPEDRDDVIAAARAAASWARARRATWTSAPLPTVSAKARKRRSRAEPTAEPVPVYAPPPIAPSTPPPIETAPPPVAPPPPVVAPPPVITAPPVVTRPPVVTAPPVVVQPPVVAPTTAFPPVPSPPPASTAAKDAGPSLTARVGEGARAIGAPLVQWLPRLAAVAALGAAALYGGPYIWNQIANRPKSPEPETRPAERTPAAAPAAPAATARRRATGSLAVSSTPPGAQVFVDGKLRGVTPLSLADLATGKHAIELRSNGGSVQRTVTIAADETAEMDESIFSGWLAVHSPFDVVINEGSRALTLDDRSQVMLPPGRHTVRVVNKALAYDVAHQVELKPGEITHLTINPAPSPLTLTASEPVTVWLDGERLGDTPLNAVPVKLGTHDLVVRRAAGGERRLTITVTANPFALHIDFSRP